MGTTMVGMMEHVDRYVAFDAAGGGADVCEGC